MAETGKGRGKSRVDGEMFGLELKGWLAGGRSAAKGGGAGRARGRVLYVGLGVDLPKALKTCKGGEAVPAWLVDRALKKRGEATLAQGPDGPLWLVLPQTKPGVTGHQGLLDPSAYGVARDALAGVAGACGEYALTELEVQLETDDPSERLGALVGLEMGGYRYKSVRQPQGGQELPRLSVQGAAAAQTAEAAALGVAVNLARHLVNVPAGELNPESLSAALVRLFAGSATTSVEVWSGKRLEKERMGLLSAVGGGAKFGPALVHIRYRPQGAKGRPLAFVGKGITFDTGGLDIKDAGGMRLMKKDMGGAASLVGLAFWAERAQPGVPIDLYLALAENAVDKDAYHPGDVIQARAGVTVEIDNTDAEGRLVLADALDVAQGAKGKDAPAAIVDLATLTGAMRVALGTRVAGMFASDDALAAALLAAAQRRGEPAWRMPLFGEYFTGLKSVVADVANSGPSRFGGAITAALFLQRFVGQVPWAHFDMYAWTEAGAGGCGEPGGSGQLVQSLADFLTAWRGL